MVRRHAHRRALCACGPGHATSCDIVSKLSAPPRAPNKADAQTQPVRHKLAGARPDLHRRTGRTRTPDAPIEVACRTTGCAGTHAAMSSIEGRSLLFATPNLPEVPSNGEAEGPHRSAGHWHRGRTISSRPRRQPRSASRTPPAIVRARPHRSHCARAKCRAQIERESPGARTGAGLARACTGTPPNEGSWIEFPALHESQLDSWMRALTGKLRGRTEAPARGAEGAQSLSARGAKQEAPHGPLQRLLEVSAIRPSTPCH
jgi:hypothetical protein